VLRQNYEKLGKLVHEESTVLSADERFQMLRELYRELNANLIAVV
jgi:hypothetical protein